jgi:predicted flap endonuclease-1-like 5' DNA nuclease
MTKLVDIEGIGPAYAQKLEAAGLKSLEDFLNKATTPKARKELAEKTDISDALILKWANRADLYRIKGIGSEYSDLLEAAGVDTVPELAQRKPENLLEKMDVVNKEKQLVRRPPAISMVTDWVAQAKKLPRVLTY